MPAVALSALGLAGTLDATRVSAPATVTLRGRQEGEHFRPRTRDRRHGIAHGLTPGFGGIPSIRCVPIVALRRALQLTQASVASSSICLRRWRGRFAVGALTFESPPPGGPVG